MTNRYWTFAPLGTVEGCTTIGELPGRLGVKVCLLGDTNDLGEAWDFSIGLAAAEVLDIKTDTELERDGSPKYY